MLISIVVPVYNEEKGISELFARLKAAIAAIEEEFEVIFVDDGSSDGTYRILKEIAGRNRNVRLIKFDGNYGQHAAILAGIKNSRGGYICSIDADLQNDPGDIGNMLVKVREGYDVVKGIRVERKAPWMRKRYSFMANTVLRRIVNKDIRDYGCTFGLYNRKIFDELFSRGRLPKYILLYAFKSGGNVIEIPVKDFKRRDSSRYHFFKLFGVFSDLIMTFLIYSRKGYKFFKASLSMSYAGMLVIAVLLAGDALGMFTVAGRAALLLLLAALGLGQLLSHMMIRKHILEYDIEFSGKAPYNIEEII